MNKVVQLTSQDFDAFIGATSLSLVDFWAAWRVIFEPAWLPKLFATRRGAHLRRNLVFVRGKVWWRHDEHYHVDFRVPCRALRASG